MKLEYPTFGEGVVLYGDSAVIGRSVVGSNVWIALGTKVVDEDVPSDTMVFGQSPNLIMKPAKRNVADFLFSAGV